MLALIAAIDSNQGIGYQNTIPWNIPAERQHFHRLTTGHPVIMGRKTFDSLPHLLPDRLNIVVSRRLSDTFTTPSLHSAIAAAQKQDDQVFIIGGGDIFNQTIDLADTLYISHLKKSYPSDTFFPRIDKKHWRATHQTEYAEYKFVIYNRI